MIGYVYFLQCGTDKLRFKIGFSKKPEKRARDLSNANPEPVHLIGYVVGSMKQERAAHLALLPLRLKGEWYPECERVQQFIGVALRDGIAEALIREDERPAPKPQKQPAKTPKTWGESTHSMQREIDASQYEGGIESQAYWNDVLRKDRHVNGPMNSTPPHCARRYQYR